MIDGSFATMNKILIPLAIAFLVMTGIVVESEALLSRTISIEGARGASDTGISISASWYGYESCTNPKCLMANGEVFKPHEISCASRKYYGKTLKIEYKGKVIDCPVKDKIAKRFDESRVDLSKKAFSELEVLDKGLIRVRLYEL